MSEFLLPRNKIGILTQNDGKLRAADRGINQSLFEIVQIGGDYPERQADTSLQVAAMSAVEASTAHGIPVIREDHSIHFDGIGGLPGPYAKHAERQLGVDGLLEVLRGKELTGSYLTSAVLSEPSGRLIGATSKIDFRVSPEPRGDLQPGWARVIMLPGEERTMAEYPEEDRLDIWSRNYSILSDYLVWRQKRLLYITGPHAAGKTEAATMISERHGIPYIDLGPTIRQAHANSGSNSSLGEWIKEMELREGEDFTDSLLSGRIVDERATKQHPNGFAVIGSRSIAGLVYIDEALESTDSLHIHIDASSGNLHSRYCSRENRMMTDEEFKQKLEQDDNMGLQELSGVSDLHITNDHDLADFFTTISLRIKEWDSMLPSSDLTYIDPSLAGK